MRARRLAALVPLLLCALACGRGPRHPDVIVVTLDTTRADHLGCYGAAEASTPHLDALARESLLFTRAATPVPLTFPSHCSIMTGQAPPHHGVRNNGRYVLPPSASTLAESFLAAGYKTGAFVSAFVLDRQFGLAQGFEAYDDTLWNERPGAWTVERAVRWLKRQDRGAPLFLWVHLYDPHVPWTPPPPYSRLDLPSAYAQEIAAMDGAIGSLLEALHAAGRMDGAIVAVLGDHGEGLGDHGEAEHGVFLYNETTRVPFLLRLPRGKGAGRSDDLVSTLDLAPTLLARAGLPALSAADGIDLSPLTEHHALPERRGLYLETMYPKENFGWSPLFAYETDAWKWIRAPRGELYDLKDDPGERANRADRDTAQALQLDRRLERAILSFPAPERQTESDVSPEVEERLRSLGYLSGDNLTRSDEGSLPDPKDMISSQAVFEEAKRAMDDGRFDDAVPPFRRVLAAENRNLVANLGLGLALVKTCRWDEAEPVLLRAIELSPGNTTAQAALADAFFGRARWSEALDLYQLALRDRTQARHVESRIALCMEKLGRPSDADLALSRGASAGQAEARFFQEFRRRLDLYRQARGDDALALARAAAGVGYVGDAEALLARGGTLDPERLDLLATLYIETNRPAKALAALESLEGARGRTPGTDLKRANLLLALHRDDEALATFESMDLTALKGSGQLAALEYDHACALNRLGRSAEALDALERAVGAGYDALGQLLNDVDLASLRGEERFLALTRKLARSQKAPARG